MNRGDLVVQQVVTGILAFILLGGTVALALLGRPVPEFLVGFDGVIVTAAFANGAFFAQARTAQPTMAALTSALQEASDRHHELALAVSAGTPTTKSSANSGNEHAGDHDEGGTT